MWSRARPSKPHPSGRGLIIVHFLNQKIGVLSTQGEDTPGVKTAIDQNPAGAGEVLLSVEPGADRLKEESHTSSRKRHGVSMSIKKAIPFRTEGQRFTFDCC